jgi:DNA-binding NtrC family response regulator
MFKKKSLVSRKTKLQKQQRRMFPDYSNDRLWRSDLRVRVQDFERFLNKFTLDDELAAKLRSYDFKLPLNLEYILSAIESRIIQVAINKMGRDEVAISRLLGISHASLIEKCSMYGIKRVYCGRGSLSRKKKNISLRALKARAAQRMYNLRMRSISSNPVILDLEGTLEEIERRLIAQSIKGSDDHHKAALDLSITVQSLRERRERLKFLKQLELPHHRFWPYQ